MTGPAKTAPDAVPDPGEVGQPQMPLVFLGHDLQSALADMRAGLGLLCDLSIPDSAQDTLQHCVAAGEALSRLIDQSLLVCMGEASPALTRPTAVQTAEFVTTLRKRWAGKAARTGHVFQVWAAPDLPASVLLDRTALDRITANLVTNTLRHTPPCTMQLSLSQSHDKADLLLEMADTGPGFSAAQLQLLSQGQSLPCDPARPHGGFGLQSVAFLVRAMGGRVRFANGDAGGALIRMRLPLALPDDAARPLASPCVKASPGAKAGLAGLAILLAEDSPTQRLLLETQLASLGARPIAVADGAAAVAALSRAEALPDLVILDDEMPGLSGLDVLSWMGTHLPGPIRPPVLVLTCHADQARTNALLLAGASLLRQKPLLTADELERAAQDTLAAQASPAVPPDCPADDLAALRRLAEIAGPIAATELFDRLGEDLARVRAGLASAARSGDIAAIRQQSHILIALAGTAGASNLHNAAAEVNSLTHSGGAAERIAALAAALDGGIAALMTAVQRMANAMTHAMTTAPAGGVA